MTFWLLVILGLVILWYVLAPRTGQSTLSARQGVMARVPFLKRPTRISSENLRVLLQDAVRSATAGNGIESDKGLREFSLWLNSLSKQELDDLTSQMNAIAAKSRIDLTWAKEGYVNGALRQDVQQVLLFEGLGIWRTRALTPLIRLEDYRSHPNTRANKQFAQKVFTRLAQTDSGLIAPEMMLAPEKERARFVHAAIDNAWYSKQDTLIEIVRQVMNEGLPAPEVKTVTAVAESSAPPA